MKHICVVTGTRAEYYLLYSLIKRLENDIDIKLHLVVTGSHLSSQYGMTVHDIERDKFHIEKKIEILNNTDSICDIDIAIGRAIIKFGEYFDSRKQDLLFILGDRYEMLGVAIAAMNRQIPIAHIHGGEVTEGVVDECIRHSITKMSYLHFTSCESYRKRVIQLGEEPERVFNVGALGVENIKNIKFMSKKELEKDLEFSLDGCIALFTFHPTTSQKDKLKKEFKFILEALQEFPELRVIFTKANADSGGLLINEMLDSYVKHHQYTCKVVYNLGLIRYLSVMNIADIVVGNSSSGILETPVFKVPTVNIGNRQKGRIQAANIINCDINKNEIIKAINKALSREFREKAKKTENPYGVGESSKMILNITKEFLNRGKINLKKSFYNIQIK